ncbi:MAG: hypothetical protein UY48_C0017G0015 [Candidatus Gottesmanbacteria bacterium GW2011_GWB1_49_7]|uniref:Uncharacterized protein n=1 Tax=Candidatus Gottesmanbacteria bacterium GW2011_GWB1_49_7 TaxID=1618448 RepID=A0A0G1Y9D9_9BACT|nr:MAG: hypothetical protein UY48_C0017G0015 [Candidatus Gottesmanbacteria bacterium GW2011_GWB1_49_7]
MLITLADFKTDYNLDATQDAQITRLITRMGGVFTGKCERSSFESATYTDEYYNGTGGGKLFVYDRPVTAVASLYEVDDEGSATLIDAADYQVCSDYIYMSAGFAKGIRNYKITYTAGYSTIPADIQEAVSALVMREFKYPGRAGVSGEGFGTGNASFFDGLPLEVQNTIRKYKANWIITKA